MKKVLVTGANVGLGKECARQLASIEGIEKIYLGCRNQEKAEAAKADLETSTGKQIYEVVIIDTSDLPSVRKAVASLEAIDGLVMNAGGGFPLDLTSDGVTQSFAVNVLGHVVLTESLIEAGKLSGSVVYSSSEMVRGVSEMGMQQVKLNDSSVEEFKTVADGNFIKNIKSKDHKMDSYGVIKYMGTLWMSYMARQHSNVRFVSISPGATSGTNGLASLPGYQRVIFKTAFFVMSFFGNSHGLETGAKRYVDALVDEETYKSGAFYASAKGMAGPVGDQGKLFFSDVDDAEIQNNANEAIHSFLK
jgi:NAD(P)-dependent dehydrogenase (short-subunit alcohol dehydrogenase family)